MNAPWYFELLAIEPTDDARIIKRAYASLLKRLDQEIHAEEFARLREAYELALAWEDDGELDYLDEAADESSKMASAPLLNAIEDSFALLASEPVPTALAYARLDLAPVDTAEDTSLADESLAAIPSKGGMRRTEQAEKDPEVQDKSLELAHAAPAGNPAIAQASTAQEHFEHFIARVRINPGAAALLLEEALQDDLMISLSAREQFERCMVDWIYWNFRSPFGALFEVAATKFGWNLQAPLGTTTQRVSLERRVAQWCHWLEEDAQWRESVLNAAVQASSGRIDKAPRKQLLASQKALNTACERYPEWMSLYLAPERLDNWNTRLGEMTGPTYWDRFKAYCQDPKFLLCILFTALITPFVMQANTQPIISTHKPPAFVRVLEAFQPSIEFCRTRAKLGGRWIQLYGNELNYRSFKKEVDDCQANGAWPGGQAAAAEYLQRLEHAWRHADDPQNVSMIGRETGITADGRNRAFMICDPKYQNDPELGGCVGLAATYRPERASVAYEVSQGFCSDRAAKPWAWHFDEGREWDNYQGFRQEVTDCIANGWWPGGIDSANTYVMQMNDYWRDRYPNLLPPLPSTSTAGANRATQQGSTLTVGPSGRLVIGAGGMQISGDVRINGKPLSTASDVSLAEPE